MDYENPMLSVDVVAIRFDPTATPPLQLGIAPRVFEPHLGELALPGVLMRAGERVVDAAARAVTSKLGIDRAAIRTIVVGRVFDTPERDERGPTVSIGCLAVIAPGTDSPATWVGFDDVPALPFDHGDIIVATRAWLQDLVWSHRSVLSALVGEVFSTNDMAALEDAVTGTYRNQANVHRKLNNTGFLERTDGPVTGRGRPQTYWRFVPER